MVYTTTHCTRCELTKRFLSQLGIPFRETSLLREDGAIDELISQTGTFSAPVVIIGRRFVRGYNPEALLSLLREEGFLTPEA